MRHSINNYGDFSLDLEGSLIKVDARQKFSTNGETKMKLGRNLMKSVFLSLMVLAILVLSFNTARAATYTVTKTADTDDGVCDADCSLREALSAVNGNRSGGITHRIEFSSLFDTPQTIATSPQLFLDYNTKVEIIGRGNQNLTITTVDQNGAFQINSTYCRIYNIKFKDCQNELDGGAMFGSDGEDLIIERCLFENNNTGKSGGALYFTSFSNLIVKDSTFRNNIANASVGGGGGAIFAGNYDQTIINSTFSRNQNSSGNGSAIVFDGGSATTSSITNSTLSGNTAANGSTIFNWSGTLMMTNITIAGNSGTAAAIDSNVLPLAQASINNSIIALNTGGNVGNVTLNAPNLSGGNPMLGPLAFNGGETETCALLAGSPAIDAGSSTLTVDQRGAVRPIGTTPDLGAFETGTAITSATTPTGSNVNTPLGSVSLTFLDVTTAGTTTQIPILPSGTPPGGYSFGTGFPAFQLSTTAVYTPPITICMQVPMSVPLATFNALEILHFENGAWIPLSPTGRSVATYTVCSITNTLSPFAVAENLSPTTANISISGRVLTRDGRGLSNAIVYLTDASDGMRIARTGSFGYYRFDEVTAGQTIVMGVRAKNHQFQPRSISVNEDLTEVNFVPLGEEKHK